MRACTEEEHANRLGSYHQELTHTSTGLENKVGKLHSLLLNSKIQSVNLRIPWKRKLSDATFRSKCHTDGVKEAAGNKEN